MPSYRRWRRPSPRHPPRPSLQSKGILLDALGGLSAQFVQRFDRIGKTMIALVLGRLRLLELGLCLIPPMRKLFDMAPTVLDNREHPAFHGVEIVDHAIAHHRI